MKMILYTILFTTGKKVNAGEHIKGHFYSLK